MKVLFTICMMVIASSVWAGEMPAPVQAEAAVIKGEVLEAINVETYTYLRLQTHQGELWAAVIKAPVSKGSVVTIEDAIVMNNFESKSLHRTFPMVVFGRLGGAAKRAPISLVLGSSYLALGLKSGAGALHVPKASGANAKTVAEIMTKGAELRDKTVLLRGKVMKFNPDIMDRNWIHLQDGTGSEADESNDILVTSKEQVKVGDVVTVKGIVRTDKDFGAGYAYKVLIEEATLQ